MGHQLDASSMDTEGALHSYIWQRGHKNGRQNMINGLSLLNLVLKLFSNCPKTA